MGEGLGDSERNGVLGGVPHIPLRIPPDLSLPHDDEPTLCSVGAALGKLASARSVS